VPPGPLGLADSDAPTLEVLMSLRSSLSGRKYIRLVRTEQGKERVVFLLFRSGLYLSLGGVKVKLGPAYR
jgi:hypothetical protein